MSDISAQSSSVAAELGVRHFQMAAYHPQANGIVARAHQSLKVALIARLTNAKWMRELPLVVLGMRTTWMPTTGLSTSQLLYGAPLRLPGQSLAPTPRDTVVTLPFMKQLRKGLSKVVPHPIDYHANNSIVRIPPS